MSDVKILSTLFVLVLVCLAASPRAAANQVLHTYVDIGNRGSLQALATDSAGNIFTVSTIINASGHSLIQVNKLDPNGNALASVDFGSAGATTSNPSQGVPAAQPYAAATDPQGNLIIVGSAYSTGFPLVAPLFPSVTGGSAFITKIDSQLHGIVFSTLLVSGSSASAVFADAQGNIYVGGDFAISSLPITPGAYHQQADFPAFIVELSPNGDRLLYSTQLGGNTECPSRGGSQIPPYPVWTSISALSLDSSGAIVFAGSTWAADLPVTPGVVGPTCTALGSGFVAKLSPGGGQLEWATYLNGGQPDNAYFPSANIKALALDSDGNVVLGGTAASVNPGFAGFQTTAGTVQPQQPAPGIDNAEGFVAKLNPTATQFVWSTYFGGGAGVNGIGVLPVGGIALTGHSDPSLFARVFGNHRFRLWVYCRAGGRRIEASTTLSGAGFLHRSGIGRDLIGKHRDSRPGRFGLDRYCRHGPIPAGCYQRGEWG